MSSEDLDYGEPEDDDEVCEHGVSLSEECEDCDELEDDEDLDDDEEEDDDVLD